MKMNITITNEMRNEEIVEICICNGNWKYWDDYMEALPSEKQSLTINTINKAYYLHYPVKDEIQHYDYDLYKKTGELKETDKSFRAYESLLSFLNYRIDNVKEDYCKWNDKEHTFRCAIFDDITRYAEKTIESEISYKSYESYCFNKGLKWLTVKIEVID